MIKDFIICKLIKFLLMTPIIICFFFKLKLNQHFVQSIPLLCSCVKTAQAHTSSPNNDNYIYMQRSKCYYTNNRAYRPPFEDNTHSGSAASNKCSYNWIMARATNSLAAWNFFLILFKAVAAHTAALHSRRQKL